MNRLKDRVGTLQDKMMWHGSDYKDLNDRLYNTEDDLNYYAVTRDA